MDLFQTLSLPDVMGQPAALAAAILAVVFAYLVFSLVGFGSALLASGPLAALMPVARVIPLLALLDCLGASRRAWASRTLIDRASLGRLLPGMIGGQCLGVLALRQLPAAPLALLLGLFILIQGLRGLGLPLSWRGAKKAPPSSDAPSAPGPTPGRQALAAGLFGGVLGGLFGSGGFIYAAYLSRHLPDRPAFRATQAVLIGLSTAWRLILCAIGGLVDLPLLLTGLALLPAALLGQWLGHHVDLRLSQAAFLRFLNGLLVISGLALILRHAL